MGLLKTLVKIVGILLIIIGIVLLVIGLYALSGGAGWTFTINDQPVTAQEFGQTATPVGIVILLIGIVISYLSFRKKE